MLIKHFNQYIKEDLSHSSYIPSYDECRKICDANNNFLFYESKHNIDGYDISIFNYRLAQPANFEQPIEGDKKIKGHELRGLTFVFNKDGSLFSRYLMLDKFWNMNQSPCSMYSIIKDYKIKSIYNKEDGSIASFIRLPNNKVIARSKTSFISEQAVEVQKIYERWPNIQQFVNFCMDKNIVPIFEYVSPTNRIVVPYANTDLILLRMRDNKTGQYLDISDFSDKLDGITVAPSMNHTLDELVELKDVIEGKEGWIVQFENGKMVKIKSKWYFELHGLYTQELNRENTLISLIIDEKIDDVISQLGEDYDKTKRQNIDAISNIINDEIYYLSNKVDSLLDEWTSDTTDSEHYKRKNFVLKNKQNPAFSLVMSIINGKDKMDQIKMKIKNETKNLLQARKWLGIRGWEKIDTIEEKED